MLQLIVPTVIPFPRLLPALSELAALVVLLVHQGTSRPCPSWCWDLKQCGREKMTSSLLSQPRTIVLHKPKKVFGSFLVT